MSHGGSQSQEATAASDLANSEETLGEMSCSQSSETSEGARASAAEKPSSPMGSNSQIQVELEINESSDERARYIGWTPVRCRIRQLSKTPSLEVLLENAGTKGKASFWGVGDKPAKPEANTLTLRLPEDGSWVRFWMGGSFGHASENDKDAALRVKSAGVTLLVREFMVRIRKNANKLKPGERDRFLKALAAVNSAATFQPFRDMHVMVVEPVAHSNNRFFPWHRAYLLDLERELQHIDPSITLPYWHFAEGVSTVCSEDFMGKPLVTKDAQDSGQNKTEKVIWGKNNNLRRWQIDGVPGIQRMLLPDAANFGNDLDQMMYKDYSDFRDDIENGLHATAHLKVFSGWIVNTGTAPRDPLFFLLHCNIDRLWAKWQHHYDRFDPKDKKSSYSESSPSGTAQPKESFQLGAEMWPWNGGVVKFHRTDSQVRKTFKDSPCVKAPGPRPTIRSQIDYQGRFDNEDRLGFDYDDVLYDIPAVK